MKRSQYPLIVSAVLALGLCLSSCAGQTTPAPMQANSAASGMPSTTAEIIKSLTVTPPPPTPTDTATPAPASATNTTTALTPAVDLALYTSGSLSGNRFFFALQSNEPVEGDYYAVVDRDEIYECSVLSQYPNRLYCTGRLVGIDRTVPYEIFETNSGASILIGEIFLPLNLL